MNSQGASRLSRTSLLHDRPDVEREATRVGDREIVELLTMASGIAFFMI